MIDHIRAGLFLGQMKRNQWFSPQEISSIAEERLISLVRYAQENVPHYSKSLKGLNVRSIDDLQSLPITQKSEIRRDPESFVSIEHRPAELHSIYTSGSSGVPLRLYYSKRDSAYGFALKFHALTEFGFGPRHLLANMMVSRMPPHPLNRLIYRAVNVSPFVPEEQSIRELSRMRPDVVMSFPSTLISMSSVNDSVNFGLAVSASEVLSANSRRAIEKSFSCKVRNYYGANESWAIGWECEKGRMHVNSDSVLLEILDGQGRPARHGNVTITSLWRYSMPMIRYSLGDVSSVEGRCPCGRGLAVLGPIEGRANAFLRLPSGRITTWLRVQQVLKTFPGLLQFQGIQESEDELTILINHPSADPGIARRIGKKVSDALPERLSIKVQRARSMNRNKAGKTVDFISRVA